MATTRRGARKPVYVTLMGNRLNYGWLTSPRTYTYGPQLGFKDDDSSSNLVLYGTNYPKPPKASKIISGIQDGSPIAGLSESVSSFCDPSKVDDLRGTGWTVSLKTARLKGIKTTGRVRTFYVELNGGGAGAGNTAVLNWVKYSNSNE